MKRRVLSFILCCSCITGILRSSVTLNPKAEVQFLLGDADISGEVEIIDVTAVLRHGALVTPLSFKGENLADINRDGDADTIDATLLQRYLSQITIAYPIGEPVPARPMRFENGMAQKIISVPELDSEGCGDVVRYTVYVETDYDTDLDGLPDLVKAWIQLPRPAAEGDYRAPVILEANPYSAGTRDPLEVFSDSEEAIDEAELQSEPPKRIPSGTVTTESAARSFRPSDVSYYTNYRSYDDYLSRGFAVAGSAGLGTRGSEGLLLSGSRMEADAYRCIIEWLCGKRTAYTDRSGNTAITADWSSGNVGMTGFSYSGALAFEVAASGVDGLKTIVPISAPANWYDYTNSQGISKSVTYDYSAYLGGVCSSRFFDSSEPLVKTLYERWRRYAIDRQNALQGDYGDYWERRDFSSHTDALGASALIVQGLNDDNVSPKQADLMSRAFIRCGITPKLLLHQNSHVSPIAQNTDIAVGDMTCKELMNRWFSHYLAGVDNGIESLPAILTQSNTDGKFRSYISFDTDNTLILSPDNDDDTASVTAKGAYKTTENLLRYTLHGQSCAQAALWTAEAAKPLTVKGATEIDLRLKTDNLSTVNPTVAAILVDSSDKPFDAYVPFSGGLSAVSVGASPYQDGDTLIAWSTSSVQRKIIASGIMDLRDPYAGYLPETAVKAAETIQDDAWYDYKLYLNPTIYTVQAGHRLELYILPYVGLPNEWDNYTPEELEALGYTDNPPVIRRDDYTFTIDSQNSAARIPLA